ncbi:MAG: UDP-N-acetylglucosamine 1-carboxyvinyltransferase [Bacillota bacterium]|jgi:UDP-N-acetylglucosamine 1-carboxyvinyltransferase
MKHLVIWGGRPLEGKVQCDGAKNAALPILAGALLTGDITTVSGVPNLADVQTMLALLSAIGADVEEYNGQVRIKTNKLVPSAPYDLVRKMRASFLVMGPLLVRCGKASMPLPGGCAIGQRPVDLHLKGFEAMGATISMDNGYIHARAPRLHGAEIYLDVPSVGATENLMGAASLAYGDTIIENAAQEPEVVDLANFLNSAGAQIKGAGTSRIRITGVRELAGTNYTIIPDRIEAATYLVAAAITAGKVLVENVIPLHLKPVLAKLHESGNTVIEGYKSVEIQGGQRLTPVNIKTLPYPGFPTDVQALFASLCSLSQGTSVISETIFENRFGYAEELRRMGASIRIEGPNAIIEGVPTLTGARVQAGDLRAGAALCIAALAAQGISYITGLEHIERGYARLPDKFRSLGARISLFDDDMDHASGFTGRG